MSLGNVNIMMFYGRPEKVHLTRSIKLITTKFLKNIFSIPPGKKTIEFNQCLTSFGGMSQGHPNCVLK